MVFLSFPIILIVLILLGVIVAKLFRPAGMPGPNANSGVPACGNCGYPARGISSLNCPECGADLREAGIVKPGRGRHAAIGCLVPIGWALVCVFVGVLVFTLVADLFPVREVATCSFHLRPASGQFDHAAIRLSTSATGRRSQLGGSGGVSARSQYSSGPQGSVMHTQLSLSSVTPPARIDQLRIDIVPAPRPGVTSGAVWFEVEQGGQAFTRIASNNTSKHHNRPLTRQDVLNLLGVAGADINDPQLQTEADQLHTVITQIAGGQSNIAIQGYSTGVSSSGYSVQQSPAWHLGYIGLWVLIWLAGTIWFIRRARAGNQKQGRTESPAP